MIDADKYGLAAGYATALLAAGFIAVVGCDRPWSAG